MTLTSTPRHVGLMAAACCLTLGGFGAIWLAHKEGGRQGSARRVLMS